MSGTWSIIDPSGLVLTNSHVIFDREAKAPYQKLWVFCDPIGSRGTTRTTSPVDCRRPWWPKIRN